MKKHELIEMFKKTEKSEAQFIVLEVTMPGFEKPETIVNPVENYDKKLEYILNTYDDDLKHLHSIGVAIVNAYPLKNSGLPTSLFG